MIWRHFIALVLAGMFFGGATLRADDTYVHTFTGFTFPPEVGAFSKTKVMPFNAAHSDIEVDYNNYPYTVHLSVYVYPGQGILKDHYELCKHDVFQVHPDAKLLEEKPMALNKGGVQFDGFRALYSFRGKFIGNQDQELLSQLILFQRSDYYVLFRISYAASDKTNAEAQITDFIDKLAWPAGDGSAPASK